MQQTERLAVILRGDRVHVLNTPLCGTVLSTDDEFAFVALDNTPDVIAFAIEQLRPIGH
jgi:hypothetical protein